MKIGNGYFEYYDTSDDIDDLIKEFCNKSGSNEFNQDGEYYEDEF